MKRMLSIMQAFFSSLVGSFVLGAIGLVVILGVVGLMYYQYYVDRVLPGVSVAGYPLAGLQREALIEQLHDLTTSYETTLPQKMSYMDYSFWVATPAGSLYRYDLEETADTLISAGKTSTWYQLPVRWADIWRNGLDESFEIDISEHVFDELAASMSAMIAIEEIPGQFVVDESSGELVVVEGEDGRRLDEVSLKHAIASALSTISALPMELPVEIIVVSVSEDQLRSSMQLAEQLLASQLLLSYDGSDDLSWSLDGVELLSFLGLDGEVSTPTVTSYVTEVAASINQEPVNAKFEFDEVSGKVAEFAAAEPGITVDEVQTVAAISTALLDVGTTEKTAQVVVRETPPTITNEMANDLGIETLLGRGESTYFGSIASRVHNVALAAAKIHGTLVPPGEEFSYNTALGDVSAATGFQSAYVIKNGRTEIGDGGGVCQDSTTLFRAVLDAGLPITEWRNHSYRVGYYEQNAKPGLDATVYAPTTDFVFVNDTQAHILVTAVADTPNRALTISLYGSDDGRESEISNHVVWGITPPPPDEYTDDPTLPAGTVKQVDWSAPGAKAKFDYVVTRDGETLIERTFSSYYKPWSAKFLRGTGS